MHGRRRRVSCSRAASSALRRCPHRPLAPPPLMARRCTAARPSSSTCPPTTCTQANGSMCTRARSWSPSTSTAGKPLGRRPAASRCPGAQLPASLAAAVWLLPALPTHQANRTPAAAACWPWLAQGQAGGGGADTAALAAARHPAQLHHLRPRAAAAARREDAVPAVH